MTPLLQEPSSAIGSLGQDETLSYFSIAMMKDHDPGQLIKANLEFDLIWFH